jgi:UDP-N-acetylmuramoylalanine--D-glutamate ligase
VVLGAGESGVGAAYLAQQQGMMFLYRILGLLRITISSNLQQWNIRFEENQHTEERNFNAAEVIKSPGIPDKAPIIKKLKEKGVPVISEIEFAGRYTNAKIICITGSNGKTTTTSFTYHILKNAGLKCWAGR